jgi:hypothetical protein
MESWKLLLGTTLLACAAAACSKTEDTAPESRSFGASPVIQSATLQSGAAQTAVCDYTNAINFWLPGEGSLDVQLAGPVSLGTAYQELTFSATVSDPDSKTIDSDILLVSASFIDPSTSQVGSSAKPEEKTLILFDDGGQLVFPYHQSAVGVLESCTPEGTDFVPGTSSCTTAQYDLKSGDVAAKDGVYGRKFALVPLRTQNGLATQLAQDCVAKVQGESPQSEAPGSSLTFRIDAVDRQGNLTTFPTRLATIAGSSTFICQGDDCFCCYVLYGPDEVKKSGGKCRGLPGMQGTAFPDGYCNSVNISL